MLVPCGSLGMLLPVSGDLGMDEHGERFRAWVLGFLSSHIQHLPTL